VRVVQSAREAAQGRLFEVVAAGAEVVDDPRGHEWLLQAVAGAEAAASAAL